MKKPKKPLRIKIKSPPIGITSFNYGELREAIMVHPMMVQELLDSMEKLTRQSELPLKTYSIHTSIHMSVTKAYIIDSDMNKQLIHFFAGNDPGEDEDYPFSDF